MTLSPTKEEIERNQHVYLGRCWNDVRFSLSFTYSLIHGEFFICVEENLIADDVPVVVDRFDDPTVD